MGNIGLFNDSFPPIMDGVAVTMENYAFWMWQKTRRVCVVTAEVPGYHYDNKPYPVYTYHSLPVPTRHPYRMGIPRFDWSFDYKLDSVPFDIIHAHSPFASGALAHKVAERQGIPFIATFHSKYRDDFKSIIPDRFILDMIVKYIVKFYESADQVWIPQAAVEDTIREYGYKGPLVVMDNGSDLVTSEDLVKVRSSAREHLGIGADDNVLLFVGQHVWQKNTKLIIESLALLKDSEWKMYFVGTGYAAEEMKQMAKQLNIGNRCTFTGAVVDRAAIRDYYASADLFLFPSLYDNAPLVVREAAALRTPSLFSVGADAAQIVSDGFNGFLAKPEAAEYASRIRSLLADKTVLRKAGENAACTIVRSWSDIVDEVLDRYRHLIAGKSHRTIEI
ncbi:MAG: glycosyltransferase [Bacteroidales bacterium]|jgi:glycosyltransferase involved in cell wall biosynthesis|nr:glycosyltransferase [Bacteroidales bacterium]MCI2121543.1 glycosyltransferase [Bacteroidales bacterium]MCI2145426.1 glycosyltransferase [Bacteroidales bacterium]